MAHKLDEMVFPLFDQAVDKITEYLVSATDEDKERLYKELRGLDDLICGLGYDLAIEDEAQKVFLVKDNKKYLQVTRSVLLYDAEDADGPVTSKEIRTMTIGKI